jgi:hypothetical protein
VNDGQVIRTYTARLKRGGRGFLVRLAVGVLAIGSAVAGAVRYCVVWVRNLPKLKGEPKPQTPPNTQPQQPKKESAQDPRTPKK